MNEIIKNIESAQLKAEVPAVPRRRHSKSTRTDQRRKHVNVFRSLKEQFSRDRAEAHRATFTVRKSSNGVGVEKTWPLHSPHVVKVEVIRHGKVRRAKLNYLRDRVGKAAKVKELVK